MRIIFLPVLKYLGNVFHFRHLYGRLVVLGPVVPNWVAAHPGPRVHPLTVFQAAEYGIAAHKISRQFSQRHT